MIIWNKFVSKFARLKIITFNSGEINSQPHLTYMRNINHNKKYIKISQSVQHPRRRFKIWQQAWKRTRISSEKSLLLQISVSMWVYPQHRQFFKIFWRIIQYIYTIQYWLKWRYIRYWKERERIINYINSK